MFKFMKGGVEIKFQNDWTVSIQSNKGYRSSSTPSGIESVEVCIWHENLPDTKIYEFATPEEVANIINEINNRELISTIQPIY